MAIASKRASYGKDLLDLLFNRRLSDGQVNSPQSFITAAALTPQTFNSFYVDDKHVAEITTGLLPIRAKGTDPSLPTVGNGSYEWTGELSVTGSSAGHRPGPHADQGHDGQLEQRLRPRLRLRRRRLGRQRLRRPRVPAQPGARPASHAREVDAGGGGIGDEPGRHLRTSSAVETVPLLARVLKGSHAPNAQAAAMLAQLVAWHKAGGNLLDLNSDGTVDNPGDAIIDIAWPKLADAFMKPVIGPQLSELDSLFSQFDAPPGGQYNGWYQYFDRDIKQLLKIKQPQPFANSYCGRGSLRRCQSSLWAAIAAAGKVLTTQQGTPTPSAWRASSTALRDQVRSAQSVHDELHQPPERNPAGDLL